MATMRQQLEKAKEKLEAFIELEKLLIQLQHHHASQAKRDTPPVSKDYNQQLASACQASLEKLRLL